MNKNIKTKIAVVGIITFTLLIIGIIGKVNTLEKVEMQVGEKEEQEAGQAQVLSGKTFTTSAAGVGAAGALADYTQNLQTAVVGANEKGISTLNVLPGYYEQIQVDASAVYNKGVQDGVASITNRGEYQWANGVGTDGSSYISFQKIPAGYYPAGSNGWAPEIRASYANVASAIGLTAGKIVKGNTILGISGTAGTYDEGRTQGRNDVTGSPNSYSLYTKAQYDANYNAGVAKGESNRSPVHSDMESIRTYWVSPDYGPLIYVNSGYYQNYENVWGQYPCSHIKITRDQLKDFANSAGVGYNAGYNAGKADGIASSDATVVSNFSFSKNRDINVTATNPYGRTCKVKVAGMLRGDNASIKVNGTEIGMSWSFREYTIGSGQSVTIYQNSAQTSNPDSDNFYCVIFY